MDSERLGKWERGQIPFIQDAFFGLTPDQRELLITGICGKCFDGMFADEEND